MKMNPPSPLSPDIGHDRKLSNFGDDIWDQMELRLVFRVFGFAKGSRITR